MTYKNKLKQLLQQKKNTGALCAKWQHRKGTIAIQLRNYLGMTPKQYRKTLVNLTKVVESQMCANDWDNINFSHVPSIASARYKKAFMRHTENYVKWTQALASGDKSVKVNASAIYPYDVISGYININSKAEVDHIVAQWNALPNWVGDASILPLVDVSGSMLCPAGGDVTKSNVSCLDVAVSLGLYLADKNKGKFKDTFLTFTSTPELLHLKGNIVEKMQQMKTSRWGMTTNLHSAFDKILSTAVKGNVPANEMPNILLILSDMQFNACIEHDDSAIEMIKRKYEDHGYEMPNVVFWNINAYDNVPVKFDKKGTALVSGFSPSIVKSILAADLEKFTPECIMLETIMNSRYDI